MAAKTFLVICASALLAQTISCQCLPNLGATTLNGLALGNGLVSGLEGANLGLAGLGAGLGCSSLGAAGLGYSGLNGVALGGLPSGLVASGSGGAFPVSSASPLAPSGIAVASDNLMEGPLVVAGQLPFLSAVAFEGQLPSGGVTGVQYSCGNGNVGIVSEGISGLNAGFGGLNAGYGALNAGYGGLNAGYGLVGNVGLGGVGVSGCGCGLY